MNYVQSDIKGLNRRNVFDLIAKEGRISRTEICKVLGSSMPTVLKITDFLQEKGYVTVSGEEKTSRGRPPQILRFVPKKVTAVGIDYDGKRVKAAVCDYYGRELAFCSRPASNDLAAFFGGELPDLLEEIVRKNRLPKRDILGIGICMPGDFNSDASEVHLGPLSLIKSSERFAALSAAFSKRTRLPVYCYNDVNASAYGEFLQRDGQTRDLVFILAGDGFGSGLILDGKLRLGEHFSAGEVGYLVFDPAFCTDASEPGWFETQLSRDTLTRTFPEFAGGEKRDALLEYLARQIALAVANICNLLDVKLVVLDGDLLNETDGSLREKIARCAQRLCLNKITIETPLCAHPSLSGSASLVIQREIDTMLAGD